MTTPVYIVEGFLGSGKTKLIENSLRLRHCRNVLIFQFEEGEEVLDTKEAERCSWKIRSWDRDELETHLEEVADRVEVELEIHRYEEIWVEWNGMERFGTLEKLLLSNALRRRIHIERVMYLADVEMAGMMLGQTGEGPISQVASSDVIYLRNTEDENAVKQLEHMCKALAPSTEVWEYSKEALLDELGKQKGSPLLEWLAFALLACFLLMVVALAEQRGVPLIRYFTIFMGVFLQAVPFLLLGVLISSAIQVFIPVGVLERIFPSNPVFAMGMGIGAGFFLPVCDCASIPVFQGLLKKGVPLPAAICFMTAAPIVNPVVLLSTYYAFNGSFRAVFYRTGLGILCSFLIGTSFFIRKPTDYLKGEAGNTLFCTCGCYRESRSGRLGRAEQFLWHARMEFYSVARYLVVGIAVSTLFQAVNLGVLKEWGASCLPVALFAAILLAFLLSLCSSSDAVVARSMAGTFSTVPLLGFLVFGPMMDIKNVMMLRGYFKASFIVRLALTVFAVCFGVVLTAGLLGGGMAG